MSCQHETYIVGCEACRVRQSRRRFIFGLAAAGVILAAPPVPAPKPSWQALIIEAGRRGGKTSGAFAAAMRAEMDQLIRDIKRMEEIAIRDDCRGLCALAPYREPPPRLGARARRRQKRLARLAPIEPRYLQARIRVSL